MVPGRGLDRFWAAETHFWASVGPFWAQNGPFWPWSPTKNRQNLENMVEFFYCLKSLFKVSGRCG